MSAEKVLVVESASDICDFIVRHVLLPSSYAPLTAENGQQALELIHQVPPALIIAEAQAPGLSGLALAGLVEQEDLNIPLLLTFNPDDWNLGAVRQALQAGVADCLLKPLDAHTLGEAIRRALENTRLRQWRAHQRAQRQSAESLRLERLEDIERLSRGAREMAAILDVDQMLASVVEMAIGLTEAEEGAVLLQEGRSSTLVTRAAKNFEDTYTQIIRTPSEDRLAGHVLQTGQAVLMDAASLKEIESAHPLVHALMYVPLRSRARVLGVLRVDNRRPDHPLTSYHQRLLQALADYAAIAIENALLYGRTEVERAQFETILKEMVDGVVVAGFDHRLLLMNPSARAALQVKQAQVAGQPLEQVIENADVCAFLKGENRRGEIKLEDGRVFNAHATCIAGVGCVMVMQDITTLKELDRIKSDFVNTVSHDLRSPLTAIMGYVELIGRVGPVTELQSEFIRRIQFGVQSITALISDLLDLGRIEAGFDEQKEVTHLAAVIQFTVDSAQAQAEMKGQHLAMNLDPHLPTVLASPPRLRQMLSNLIGNAIKYTPAGGRVNVRSYGEDGTIVIKVSDTGVGIPAADLPYIFNKFYRASNIREKYDGTGLGLSIVKSIVENHGGRIWVDSKPDEGTTFTIILPQYKGADAG